MCMPIHSIARLALASAIALTGPLASSLAASTADDDAITRNAARVKQLELQMPLGPRSASSLGLRVAWRHPINIDSVINLFVSNGAVFVVDRDNEVTMFNQDMGLKQWVGFGAGGNDIIIDVVHVPSAEKVLVVRTNSILTISANTGIPMVHGATQSSVQPLEWLAATPGTLHGEAYIYGGLAGEVVWQGWGMGFSTRAHRIGRSVDSQPIVAGPAVIAASRSGNLAALNVNTGSLLWEKTLFDGISGVPSATRAMVVVASRDQHLRMFNINDGSLKWSKLFKVPLTSGPMLLNSAVYQQVSGLGLVKMMAAPQNSPGGVEEWTAADVHGDVIGTSGDLLLAWAPSTKQLQTVSANTGSVDASVSARSIEQLVSKDGIVLLLGGDGELECLRPAFER